MLKITQNHSYYELKISIGQFKNRFLYEYKSSPLPWNTVQHSKHKQTNSMNFKLLAGIFSILISGIAALEILQFSEDLRIAPGAELEVKLSGNDIKVGDHVRVELWDNQDDEDVNAAVLGEELIVQDDYTVNFNVPSHFPKTHNAFLRIYYKCYNAASPRFSIKAQKNRINSKFPLPQKPVIIHAPTATPVVIFKPVLDTVSPTPVVIHAAPIATIVPSLSTGADDTQVVIVEPVITERPTYTKSTAAILTTSASTSTSSGSVAKISAGSVFIAMAVAFAMLF